MDIYVVQPNDTIYSIATKFGVSATKLIQYNEIEKPNQLVPGQTLVIVYPNQTYTVQEGDTLESIANVYDVSIMQLLRNNPFLSNRDVYPGEEIIISFNTTGTLTTNGFVYPFIDIDTLKKTLPNLTYITIYAYRVIRNGEIISYFDDSEIIKLSKEYGTLPLLAVTSLSLQGEPDIDIAYNILTSNEYQQNVVNNIVKIIKSKGYSGANMIFDYMNISTQYQHEDYIKTIKNGLEKEGYLLFVTINPIILYFNNKLTFEEVDYSILSQYINGMAFLHFIWGVNYGPPLPVNSISNIRIFINYITTNVPPDMITIGVSLISYNWKLPYIPGKTYANSLTINSAHDLAREVGATIQFDDISQTPYFMYNLVTNESIDTHIVWSIDARTISGIVEIVSEFGLNGITLWNLMIYTPQLWLVINSQFDIVKFSPDTLDAVIQ